MTQQRHVKEKTKENTKRKLIAHLVGIRLLQKCCGQEGRAIVIKCFNRAPFTPSFFRRDQIYTKRSQVYDENAPLKLSASYASYYCPKSLLCALFSKVVFYANLTVTNSILILAHYRHIRKCEHNEVLYPANLYCRLVMSYDVSFVPPPPSSRLHILFSFEYNALESCALCNCIQGCSILCFQNFNNIKTFHLKQNNWTQIRHTISLLASFIIKMKTALSSHVLWEFPNWVRKSNCM